MNVWTEEKGNGSLIGLIGRLSVSHPEGRQRVCSRFDGWRTVTQRTDYQTQPRSTRSDRTAFYNRPPGCWMNSDRCFRWDGTDGTALRLRHELFSCVCERGLPVCADLARVLPTRTPPRGVFFTITYLFPLPPIHSSQIKITDVSCWRSNAVVIDRCIPRIFRVLLLYVAPFVRLSGQMHCGVVAPRLSDSCVTASPRRRSASWHQTKGLALTGL